MIDKILVLLRPYIDFNMNKRKREAMLHFTRNFQPNSIQNII